MADPVYKLWMMRPTEAWYQLSEEEQNRLLAKLQEALEKVGGKSVLMCASAWSSERWSLFGVEEFPDIEAVQKLSEIHNGLNWFRYHEAVSLLGIKWEPS